MRRWLLFVWLAFGLAGAASADVVPQRKWLQVRSPNFTVMGEVPARDLRRVAERVEQLHAVLGMLTTTTGAPTSDVTVVVFKDRRAFEPFQPLYEDKRVAVAGYFLPGPMNYIAVIADPAVDYSSTVYHEYIHLAAARALGEMPLWMSEGLADFYGTFASVDGGRTARLGDVLPHHLERLQREFMPLTALTAVGHDSPYYNERDKMSVFYAESWALIHFLQIGKERKYASKLSGFFNAVQNGVSFQQACVAHLGTTVDALEKEVRLYVGSPVFYRMNVPLPEVVERMARVEPAPVSEAEAHAVLAQLLLFQKREADARAHLEHAIGVDAEQPLALARLADLAARADRRDEAVQLARRVESARNPTYIAHYYRALALDRVVEDPAVGHAAVVGAWQQVVSLNPNFAEGNSQLAQARADMRTDLELARQSQERAIALAPAREEYKLGLARILIMLGDTRPARNLLGSLVARGGTPAIKTMARNYLGVAAQVELARAEGREVPVPERPPETAMSPEDATPPGIPAPASPAEPVAPAGAPPAAIEAMAAETARRITDTNFEMVVLRKPLSGEVRIFGTLAAIECATDRARLVVQTSNAVVRVRGGTLDTIDLVSYRSDIAGGINCGPQPQAPPVLVTYRPAPEDGTAGEVVIVEVVPVGYKPPA